MIYMNENGIHNCIEPLSMKMLSVLFLSMRRYRVIDTEARPKIEEHQSHRERTAEYAPSYALLHFFQTLIFCKTV